MDYISLSDYRDNTSHLERIFSVDRHACVNDREKLYWCQIALRFLLEYQRFSCRTARPAEINRFESVCKSIYSYLSKHYNHTFDSLWGCMINERSSVMGSINFKTLAQWAWDESEAKGNHTSFSDFWSSYWVDNSTVMSGSFERLAQVFWDAAQARSHMNQLLDRFHSDTVDNAVLH